MVFWTWHRRVGIVAALLVLVLSFTGIALNHTERLRLDERHVGWGWLLDWYGIDIPTEAVSFPLAPGRLSLLGDRLYLDQQFVPGLYDELVGAVSVDGMIVAVVDGDVLVLTRGGQIVDRLGGENGVPAAIDAVARRQDGSTLLRAADGVYLTDQDLLVWTKLEADPGGVVWAEPAQAGDVLIDDMRRDYKGRILSVERVLLDLHSGRIFGFAGPYLMDAAAVLLILLALTGSWLWLGRRGRDR
jgi:hypothetical protein